MAWVRPKHPPPKAPVDTREILIPMLQYLGGVRSKPVAKSRPKSSPAPSKDPILRSFQQAQAAQHLQPKPPKQRKATNPPPPPPPPPIQVYESDEESEVDSLEEVMPQPTPYQRRSVALPAPTIERQPKPRVMSYERALPYEQPKPKPVSRERHVSHSTPIQRYYDEKRSRAISEKWASATTPLRI